MTISKHGKCFTPKVVVILICFVIFSFSFNEIADNRLFVTFTNDDHSAKSEIIAFVKTSYLILRFLSTIVQIKLRNSLRTLAIFAKRAPPRKPVFVMHFAFNNLSKNRKRNDT